MRPTSPRRALRALPLVLTAVLLPGCESSSEPEIDEPFVGNWSVSTFVIGGVEQTAPGRSFNLSIGLFRDGSYQFIVGGDDSGLLCGGPPSCNEQGDYSFTASRITLDPGTPDAFPFQYVVSGNTLTVSGSIEGVSFGGSLDRR